MSEWKKVSFDSIATFQKGINYKSTDYCDEDSGYPFITIKCFVKGGGYDPTGLKFFDGYLTQADLLSPEDIVFAITDLTRAGDIVGSPLKIPYFGDDRLAVASMDCMKVFPLRNHCDNTFLYYLMMLADVRRQMVAYSAGSTVLHLDTKQVPRLLLKIPLDIVEQQKIGKILQTIDQAIESTQALIEKYQHIKAGLMHDLFTRGIGADDKLRPPREEAPELYREKVIGWITTEWDCKQMSEVLESIADGPFGSNLKTEHYVADPGVRVVRLQNVAEYEYNDTDKAFVSDKHANSLIRNRVVGGDVLIAGLGEDRYPVGRSCVYPENLPPAINKADCFRARCNSSVLLNKYLMLFLNSAIARSQIRKYEQGVTRPRINTGNLKRLLVATPSLREQGLVVARFEAIQSKISAEAAILAKKRRQKSGLMHDLLTGKVQVNPNPPEAAHAA